MTNLFMKPQIAIVPRSIITNITMTLCSFMLLSYMIHRSTGHFSPKLTFITKTSFLQPYSEKKPKYKLQHHVKLIQAPEGKSVFMPSSHYTPPYSSRPGLSTASSETPSTFSLTFTPSAHSLPSILALASTPT